MTFRWKSIFGPKASASSADKSLSKKNDRKSERQEAAGNGRAKQLMNFMLIIHSYSCISGLELFLKQIDGVESVKGHGNFIKLEVMGKVDPSKVREMVQSKTKEKVELIIPSAEREGDRNEKKATEGKLKKQVMPVNENDTTNEKSEVRIITLKIKLCCEYCNQRLERILKNKGLEMIDMNIEEDLVEVRGKVDMKELCLCINDKLKKGVEVVSSEAIGFSTKRDESVNFKEGKDKGDGGKKEKDGGSMKKVEVVLKNCFCDGCINKTRKKILKIEGVKEISAIAEGKILLVNGTMGVQELTSYLKRRAKKYVAEVISDGKENNKNKTG